MSITRDLIAKGSLVALHDKEVYAACRTNGSRATRAQMEARSEALIRIVRRIRPCSVRGAYYQATVLGIVEKTEAGYDKVQRALVELRRAGRIKYSDITDNTRWQRKPRTYSSLEEALEETARLYRRAVWADLDQYIEIWLEKDALAGVLYPITWKYDIPLMVARGFPSLTFLQSCGEQIRALGKKTYIYHLGDHDPSGVCAAEKIHQALREFAPGIELHFERLAVLRGQIEDWDLPSRPTKTSDSRAKTFKGRSVELDAIDPNRLRQIIEQIILDHLPKGQMDTLKVAEESERSMLHVFRDMAARNDDGTSEMQQ